MYSSTDSPVMVSDVMSTISDMETALGSEFDRPTSAHSNEKRIDEWAHFPMCHHCTSGSFSDGTLYNNVVDFGSSDLHLGVDDTLFKTHRHILKKFAKFDEHIKHIEENHPDFIPVIKMSYDKHTETDFRNTFKILYASVVDGPFEFEPSVLASGLRIATAYEYPGLQTFCITRLEAAPLPPLQRIQLSQECGIPSWKERAYSDFCSREEALSAEEARTLGIDAFVTIAKRREEEQRRRAAEAVARKEKIQGEFTPLFAPEKSHPLLETVKNLESIDILCTHHVMVFVAIVSYIAALVSEAVAWVSDVTATDPAFSQVVLAKPSDNDILRSIKDSYAQVVDFGAGDVYFGVGNILFKTHKHILNGFTVMGDFIESDHQDRPNSVTTMHIDAGVHWEKAFTDTFKMLYVSAYKGLFKFEPPVFISALRASSGHDDPELKSFCVSNLNDALLDPITRVKLARECDVPSWLQQAYDKLCEQDEPISKDDARILGIDAGDDNSKADRRLPERFEKILPPHEDISSPIAADKSERATENSSRTLKVLPTSIFDTPVFDIPALISILAALMICDHSQLRTFAISKLDPLVTDPVDRITLSRKYKIDRWEEDALKDLSVRKEPITPREASAIGLETFERLARMRNEHLDLKYDRRLPKVQPGAGDLGSNKLKGRQTEALFQELQKHKKKLDTIEEAVKEVLLVQNEQYDRAIKVHHSELLGQECYVPSPKICYMYF
ncbi:hypothetical protein RhiJN_03918 [Ceratobasidium sp. AG-Ba]|nr:hypothetical protein RhiJN_03918 [Ceratobasidium sp. AG-Ba]